MQQPTELDPELAELLRNMRKRPGMFFGEGTLIESISAFVRGYDACARLSGILNALDLHPGFNAWVAKKLGTGANCYWSGSLARHHGEDAKGYDAFFELLAEYKGWPPLK